MKVYVLLKKYFDDNLENTDVSIFKTNEKAFAAMEEDFNAEAENMVDDFDLEQEGIEEDEAWYIKELNDDSARLAWSEDAILEWEIFETEL